MEKFTTSGRVSTARNELMAVTVMLRATSPRKMWLNRLADVPPGEAASSIMPTHRIGDRPSRSTSPKHSTGNTNGREVSADIGSFGNDGGNSYHHQHDNRSDPDGFVHPFGEIRCAISNRHTEEDRQHHHRQHLGQFVELQPDALVSGKEVGDGEIHHQRQSQHCQE